MFTPENLAYGVAGIAVTLLALWGKGALKTGIRGKSAFDALEKDTERKEAKK